MIGSIVDYRYAPDDPEAVVELLAAPSTRVISLTITEGGYNVDSLDEDVNVFGLVADALARRRDRGITSPTIVSCDNIEGNGDVARQAFTTYADRVHPGLGEWISTHTRFPSSMVDRITPVTTPDVIAVLESEFGVADQWPVAAEPFTSWVLEDDFSDGRPPLEDADVLLVDDVTPYELMKLRLLNASHQSLCYFAYLAGYRLVHEAAATRCSPNSCASTWIRRPRRRSSRCRDRPARLQAHPDRAVRQPRRADTIARLCFGCRTAFRNGCCRSSGRTWPRAPIRLSAATVASWARYAEGVDEQGQPIDVQDQLADTLVPLARSQHENPTAFIENTAVFGDLASQPRFVEAYLWALDSLHRDGARATLETLLKETT